VAVHAFEHPGELAGVGGGRSLVGDRRPVSEAGETHAHEPVGRPSGVVPGASRLRLEHVVRFPWLGGRCLGSGFPAHFQQVRARRVDGSDPVQAVAAEIDHASAAVDEPLQGIEHRPGPVLRMSREHERAAALERGCAAGVQRSVGGDPEVRPGPFQPVVGIEVSHQQVSGEPSRVVRIGGQEGIHRVDFDPGGGSGARHRLEPGADVDRRAVAVQRVVGKTRIELRIAPQIGIRLPGEGGGEQQDLGRLAGGHDERQVDLPADACRADAVEAAAGVRRDADRVGFLPPAVVEIIPVQVDGGVGRPGVRRPAHDRRRAGHPQAGRVDQGAVPAVTGQVHDSRQLPVVAEGPACFQARVSQDRFGTPVHDVHQRDGIRCLAQEYGVGDLAVEGRDGLPVTADEAPEHQRGTGGGDRRRARLPGYRVRPASAAVLSPR
jgi:hypothetical protein